MRNILLLALGLVGLTGCTDSRPIIDPPEMFFMNVATKLPASVGALEDLPIVISGVNGCSVFDKIHVVEKAHSGLRLIAMKKDISPCPAVPNAAAFDYTYIDKTAEARTNPFEVWVNNVKVGTVEIK